MSNESPEPPITFTNAYTGLAKGARYEHWREEICRGLCNIDIGPVRDNVIDLQTQITNLSPVAVAVATGTSASIGRSPQTTGDGDDDFTFVCHGQSRMPFQYRDSVMTIDRSEVLLGDLVQSSAAKMSDCRKFTALVIDRKTLLRSSPKAETLLYRPLRINEELSDTIGRYAELATKSAPHLDGHGRFLMGQHLVDLLSLALGTHSDAAEMARQRGQAQARLALMKTDILSNLGRLDLSIDMIAGRYGLSARQAQRLFEQDGTTFTEFLIERRLLLARKLAMDPKNRQRKISDIAHSSGFSDLSYFNRTFRRRFGMTPSDVRENDLERDGNGSH